MIPAAPVGHNGREFAPVVAGRRRPARAGSHASVPSSSPSERWRNVAQYGINDVGAVVDTKLIRDGQQQRVGGGDRFILRQLFDELLRSPA